jgi:gamma-glutamylcyclotransferase
VEFFIQGSPCPKHKVGNGRKEAEKWSASIVEYTKELPMIVGPCRMLIEYRLPPDRFTIGSPYGTDLDNMTKRLLDGLKSTIFKNEESEDGCVCKIEVCKNVAPDSESTGTRVVIEQMRNVKSEEFHYFAYGSNMDRLRLSERVNEPSRECIAYLPGYKIRTNKVGVDGSGKANIEKTNILSDLVWGVVWSIKIYDKSKLDKAEGFHPDRNDSHYKPMDVIVFDKDGMPWRVMTYIGCRGRISVQDLPLADWYHDLIIRGAAENNLPEQYRNHLQEFERLDK